MILQKLKEKIKLFVVWYENGSFHDVFIVGLILLVGLSSFGLGRLSVLTERNPPVSIYEDVSLVAGVGETSLKKETSKIEKTSQAGSSVVASKSGTKYHYPNCSGASRIIAANRIEFSSATAAEAAGYTLAANCKE